MYLDKPRPKLKLGDLVTHKATGGRFIVVGVHRPDSYDDDRSVRYSLDPQPPGSAMHIAECAIEKIALAEDVTP